MGFRCPPSLAHDEKTTDEKTVYGFLIWPSSGSLRREKLDHLNGVRRWEVEAREIRTVFEFFVR